MDPKRLVIGIIGLILILALIFSVIFWLFRTFQARQRAQSSIFPSSTQVVTPAPSAPLNTNPTPAPTTPPQPQSQTPTGANSKIYAGTGFALEYPKNWGLLKCSNSQNFELDPVNSTDQTVSCASAVKPVTINTSYLSGCSGGQQINLGQNKVTKVASNTSWGKDYKWCIEGAPALEITHRVSTTDPRSAFSKQDFSSQIEEMISKLRFGTGGS